MLLDLGMSESQALVGDVKLSVVVTNEDITKDPQGTFVSWEIDAHEPTHTESLTTLRDLCIY